VNISCPSLWIWPRKNKSLYLASICFVDEISFLIGFCAAFQFHTEGAILGELILDEGGTDMDTTLPFPFFLATPLLPCAKADGPVHKFTGNDDCGAAPAKTDHLTMAIHAFAHFVAIYSQKQLVLCDLQGRYHLHLAQNFAHGISIRPI
jgi:Alpha-kinase family